MGIYLYSLTNNELEFSIPHKALLNYFLFIVTELVQPNPDNSHAECVNL